MNTPKQTKKESLVSHRETPQSELKAQTATPRRFCKVTKRDIGRNVLFLAYDGRNYRAELKDLKRGIASLVYRPFNSSGIPCDFLCTAYVSDLTRVIPTF